MIPLDLVVANTGPVSQNVYVLLPAAQPPQGRGGQKEEAATSQGQSGGLSSLRERIDTGAEQTLRKATTYPIGQSRRGGIADSQVLSICKYVIYLLWLCCVCVSCVKRFSFKVAAPSVGR